MFFSNRFTAKSLLFELDAGYAARETFNLPLASIFVNFPSIPCEACFATMPLIVIDQIII